MIKNFGIVIVLFLLSSCKKSSFSGNNKILGKWYQTESWSAVFGTTYSIPSDSIYIQFFLNDVVKSYYNGNTSIDRYQVTSDSTIDFYYSPTYHQSGFRYVLNENSLTLTGNCFEGCRTKYIKVQ